MKTANNLKLLFWTNMPNHYQRSFIDEMRRQGVDLVVFYHEKVAQDRKHLGWETNPKLPKNEFYVDNSLRSLDLIKDWRERIFILQYGYAFYFRLAIHLTRMGINWVHWSEPAFPGLRWWKTFPWKWTYAKFADRFALGIFGTGKMAIKDFRKWGMKTTKTAVLPYCSPDYGKLKIQADKNLLKILKGRKAMLYAGALSHRKAIDLMLKAFNEATRGNSDWALVLVGSDESNGKYQKLAISLGIEEKVLFWGPGRPDQVHSLMKAADVILLPSRHDGWGITLSEGASLGKALIASDKTGAAHHLIVPNRNGIIIKGGSSLSLANAMYIYIRNPGLSKVHGQNSKNLYKYYSPKAIIEKMVSTLKNWLNTITPVNKNIPNFFIVGAPKSGTTALSEYLKRNPNIFISTPKEPHFFNFDVSKLSKMSKETYLNLFNSANPLIHKAIGEASTGYLFSKCAVQEILKFNPKSKFIAILRNPIDLVQSLHAEMLFEGIETITDFESAWQEEKNRTIGNKIPLLCFEPKSLIYSEWGKLGDQITRLYSMVSRRKVKVILFDDFISNTRKTYEEVLKFLNVPSDKPISFPRINEGKVLIIPWLQPLIGISRKLEKFFLAYLGIPQSFNTSLKLLNINSRSQKRKPISPKFRDELTKYYSKDIGVVSKLIRRDLKKWTLRNNS